jgi:hypothetical protein
VRDSGGQHRDSQSGEASPMITSADDDIAPEGLHGSGSSWLISSRDVVGMPRRFLADQGPDGGWGVEGGGVVGGVVAGGGVVGGVVAGGGVVGGLVAGGVAAGGVAAGGIADVLASTG